MMKRFISNLLQTGIDKETDVSLVKNIRVMNGFAILVLASQISTLPLTLYFLDYAQPLLYVCLLMICLISLTLACNHFRRHFAAAIIGALAAINNITLYTLFLGTRSNVHFLLPAVMIGAFYYFPYNRAKAMFCITAFSLLDFIFLEIWSFHHLPFLRFPDDVERIMIVFVDLTFIFITFGFMYYGYYIYRESETNLKKEREKSERLLLNILPVHIAELLKSGATSISERYDKVAILFSDLVGFTSYCSENTSDSIVKILNEIFFAFDTRTEELGLEKIKTIGDGYMVMGGGLSENGDNFLKTIDLGDYMIRFIERFNAKHRMSFSIRVGIHVGSVTAGVIGKTKFSFDIWGDTVNVASRMESTGVPMEIHISEDVADCLADKGRCDYRGEIDVKGKGKIKTYIINRYYRELNSKTSP